MKTTAIALRLFLLFLIGLSSIGCSPAESASPTAIQIPPVGTVVQKGDRQLAIDVNAASDDNFETAFQLAKDVGIERIGLFQNWDTLETSPNTYSGQWLQIADAYYPAHNVALDLTIAVIHTNQSTVPVDLRGKPLNDPEVVQRFKALLDFVFSQMPNTHFSSLVISSEQDIYLERDSAKWDQFADFYKQIAAYVHAQKPGVPVATEFTFEGLTGPMKERAQAINEWSDVIGVSYYPLAANGNVKDPTLVGTDFDTLVSLYPDKPILFYQLGYPSSTVLESSETRQALFIHEAFRAWDRLATHIQMIDFTWLHDCSPEEVKGFTQFYGFSGKKFTEFLATLGLRTNAGLDKPAFQQLKEEAQARGW